MNYLMFRDGMREGVEVAGAVVAAAGRIRPYSSSREPRLSGTRPFVCISSMCESCPRQGRAPVYPLMQEKERRDSSWEREIKDSPSGHA